MKWWHIVLDIVAAVWVVLCAFFAFMAYALSATWSGALLTSAVAGLVCMSPSLWWFVHSIRKQEPTLARYLVVVGVVLVLGYLVLRSI